MNGSMGFLGSVFGGIMGGPAGWVVGGLAGNEIDRQQDEAARSQDGSYSYPEERSMVLTESQMTEVIKMAVLKCKEGREFDSVSFESPESGEGYMVTLRYKPI